MKLWPSVGTRSILFGVHAFWAHPVFVGLAWRRLYGTWPTWAEWTCIFVHDMAYIRKPNIDGPEGRTHPEGGAQLAQKIVGWFQPDLSAWAYDFTLAHSREYAKMHGLRPSLLAWADKYSVWYDPEWFYLLRGKLSGEIWEFKQNAPPHIQIQSDRAWFRWYRAKVKTLDGVRGFLNR